MKTKIIALVIALSMISSPAYAVRAGQYCKKSDAMKIAKVKSSNGSYMVQCVESGASKRLRWVKV